MNLFGRISTGLKLYARYLFDFWHANFTIARQVLSPKQDIAPEIIEIPTQATSSVEILVLANLISFTPGSLVLTIKPGHYVRVHVLSHAEEARKDLAERIEKPLITITRNHD